MIAKCFCTNSYQDKKYGQGMRTMNRTAKGTRCSSCGKDAVSAAKETVKKEKDGK